MITNFQKAVDISEFMSELFRFSLAKVTKAESDMLNPIPFAWFAPTFVAECQDIVDQLVDAYLHPSVLSHSRARFHS